jgi:hypothetical protein
VRQILIAAAPVDPILDTRSLDGCGWTEPSSGTPTGGRAAAFDNTAQVVRSLDTTEALPNGST